MSLLRILEVLLPWQSWIGRVLRYRFLWEHNGCRVHIRGVLFIKKGAVLLNLNVTRLHVILLVAHHSTPLGRRLLYLLNYLFTILHKYWLNNLRLAILSLVEKLDLVGGTLPTHMNGDCLSFVYSGRLGSWGPRALYLSLWSHNVVSLFVPFISDHRLNLGLMSDLRLGYLRQVTQSLEAFFSSLLQTNLCTRKWGLSLRWQTLVLRRNRPRPVVILIIDRMLQSISRGSLHHVIVFIDLDPFGGHTDPLRHLDDSVCLSILGTSQHWVLLQVIVTRCVIQVEVCCLLVWLIWLLPFVELQKWGHFAHKCRVVWLSIDFDILLEHVTKICRLRGEWNGTVEELITPRAESWVQLGTGDTEIYPLLLLLFFLLLN